MKTCGAWPNRSGKLGAFITDLIDCIKHYFSSNDCVNMHISVLFKYLNIEYPSCTLIEPVQPSISILNLSFVNGKWIWTQSHAHLYTD